MSTRPGQGRAAADEAEARLAQVSAFLLRADLASYEDALRDPGALQHYPLRPDLGLTGALYVSSPRSRPPRWLEVLRQLSGEQIAYSGNRHMSAVAFIERPDSTFALTFGYGRHLLRRDAVEADYGLKVAAGLVDPDEVASLDSRSIESTSVQVRRQTSRGAQIAAIGFDVGREMLRAIAGRVADEALGTRVVGSDSIGLTTNVGISDLASRLDAIHDAYLTGRYRTGFAHIDRWRQVPPGPDRDRLDQLLLASLHQRRAALLADEDPEMFPGAQRPPHLEAPEIIEYRASGFWTSPERRQGVIHPFPDLDAYLVAARHEPTLPDLTRNHQLELASDEPDEIVGRWRLFEALSWEVEYDDEVYVLAEGRWWRIDADYRRHIDEQVTAIPPADLDRPEFDPIEWEPDYNERLAGWRPLRTMLDRETARFLGETGSVEICDVFTSDGQFVHVKRDTSSAALSHLFAQGSVSARLFRRSSEFRDRFRELLDGDPAMARMVPSGPPNPANYEVVDGIISTVPAPVALHLPFFARNWLAQVAPDVEALGYRVRIAHIPERVGARPADAGILFRDRPGPASDRLVRRRTAQRRARAASRK